jgi:hypothetical protein
VVERWPSKPDVAGSNPVSRSIDLAGGRLTGDLTIPDRPIGLLLFATDDWLVTRLLPA